MSPLVTEADIEAVSAQMRSFWIGRGGVVQALEREMCAWVGAKHAVALGSGTAALVVALRQLGAGPVEYPKFAGSETCIGIAVDIAGKLTNGYRLPDTQIGVYPIAGRDITDYCRHLPRKGEVELKTRFGVFSFGALKDVSGGIGGCVVANEPISAEDMKRVSPLSDINAAMILSQLSRYQGKDTRLVADGRTWRL